ncbi:hypothetical protein M9Y10_042709 [Tritrichomonas musculus]|uniref:Protein kinase domain-containing protein n=1 Tax=Tritrichomonas musculus TaxID=1915356 RepID=A0ABR2JXP2_9EUKA
MNEFLDISKFIKQALIGEGTFSQVYKVIEHDTGNIFAAKISKLSETKKRLITYLKREINIISQLHHPSVLKFIGYSPIDFKHEYYPVIITEYSSNGSLEDVIKSERKYMPPPTWSDTKKLINIYGIASAMSYLHAHNIIHRDLKPANILEDDNFFPKIADFGLSKISHHNIESMTSQSTVGFKGTPIYTAPEIWLYNEFSKSGDVYSFSIILYELFVYEEPFKDFGLKTFYSKVIEKGERPEFKYPIPPCYKNLITRCWSADPNDRPTFQEIVKELRTNKEFIISSIDEEEFYDYVDMIDSLGSSFDPNKKLGTIISTSISQDEMEDKAERETNLNLKGESEKETKVKIKEESEDKEKHQVKKESEFRDLKNISVGRFNSLPLDQQEFAISSIVQRMTRISSVNAAMSIKNLLSYMKEFEWNNNIQYLSIKSEDDNNLIEEVLQERFKICLSHSTIEMMDEEPDFEVKELIEYLTNFENISIELKYPSVSFDKNYESVLKLKYKTGERIKISIFISGVTKTDMKFRNDENIDSVVFDTDVKVISGEQLGFRYTGGGSFCECSSLTRITIPSSVTSIGDYAFTRCLLLTQINIPTSVTSIGEGSFSGCSALAEISIPPSVTIIKRASFFGCSLLKLVSFTVPSSVAKIEEYAFYGCSSLTEISIPSSVSEMGDCAFSECQSLTKIYIPSSITTMGKGVFNKCKIIILSDNMTSIPSNSFYECSSLEQITIPSSVTKIGYAAFYQCSSMTQILILSSINYIGKYAFCQCSSLKQITIPPSVTIIGKSAFYQCSSLEQITISLSLAKIDERVFEGCSSLKKIIFPSSATEEEKDNFNKAINLSNNLTYIPLRSFYGCSSLEQITIPSPVTKIGYAAFYQCSSLTQILIPSSVKDIGDHAFGQCSSLKQITIPPSVAIIGKSAFNQCQSLEQITILSSLTEIDERVYERCSSLKQITIPSSVIKIGYSAFSECSSLSEITIPPSVTAIGNFAFSECSLLKQISIPSFTTQIGFFAFSKCSSLTEITIPSSVTEIGNSAFSRCTSLAQVTILSPIIRIGDYAFEGCSLLKQVTIPYSVTEIGDYAFEGCSLLKQITITSSTTGIGDYAFKECSFQIPIDIFKNKKKSKPVFASEKEFLAVKYSKENDTENTYNYMCMLIKEGKFAIPINYAVDLYKSQQYKQSFFYFSLISRSKHPVAEYFIGIMKYYGKGCQRNQEESYRILKHLSDHGIDSAIEFIDTHFKKH